MYAYINGQRWAENGQPALHELHGRLCDPTNGDDYGRILSDHEASVVASALLHDRYPAEALPGLSY